MQHGRRAPMRVTGRVRAPSGHGFRNSGADCGTNTQTRHGPDRLFILSD
ncbi:hypothetical protein ACFPM0_20295 [Pseudonocardia sulfidoxydans]